jgi:hypothetical protein
LTIDYFSFLLLPFLPAPYELEDELLDDSDELLELDDSDELLDDSDEDDSDEDDEDEDDDELDEQLEELDEPATPNISIFAKYLSMHFDSRPNRIGLASRIIHIVEVRILVQLNVTAPTLTESSKFFNAVTSAADI